MNTAEYNTMNGKTVLITGASRGIGLETAKGLAQTGAKITIVSHNEDRAKQAVEKINQASGKESAKYYLANLASQSEIHLLSQKIHQDFDHLDVLINNVGSWFSEYKKSPDGIEMTFALNHLSYFLLTGLLLDLLHKKMHARIINVSSTAHKFVDDIPVEKIKNNGDFGIFKNYGLSKLANLLFTYELSERLANDGVTVNAMHPGFVNSELYRDFGILTPVIKLSARLFGKSSEEGAQTIIYLASSPEVADISGEYFVDMKVEESSPASHDKNLALRLWAFSETLTGFNFPA
jgi:NAD(P)-dependent dehydrogenase (short-subunit alcohol dehydrogenase family)